MAWRPMSRNAQDFPLPDFDCARRESIRMSWMRVSWTSSAISCAVFDAHHHHTYTVLGMITVLKTRAVGLYLVYVTGLRYISTPRRRALEGANP